MIGDSDPELKCHFFRVKHGGENLKVKSNVSRLNQKNYFNLKTYRVRNFRGRVSYFNQSEARKHSIKLQNS